MHRRQVNEYSQLPPNCPAPWTLTWSVWRRTTQYSWAHRNPVTHSNLPYTRYLSATVSSIAPIRLLIFWHISSATNQYGISLSNNLQHSKILKRSSRDPQEIFTRNRLGSELLAARFPWLSGELGIPCSVSLLLHELDSGHQSYLGGLRFTNGHRLTWPPFCESCGVAYKIASQAYCTSNYIPVDHKDSSLRVAWLSHETQIIVLHRAQQRPIVGIANGVCTRLSLDDPGGFHGSGGRWNYRQILWPQGQTEARRQFLAIYNHILQPHRPPVRASGCSIFSPSDQINIDIRICYPSPQESIHFNTSICGISVEFAYSLRVMGQESARRKLFTVRKLAFYSLFHGLHIGLFAFGW